MKNTFAGLGASRAEVEEGVLRRPAGRNEFITFALQKRAKYSYAMTDGRFRWDDKHVYFDFYGAGKLRTITIFWSEIAAHGHLLDAHTFAPGTQRWNGKLTEFAGTAHNIWKTSQWERAAWNTVNAWCTPTRQTSNTTVIQQLGRAAQDAWARLTEDGAVYYFLPSPDGRIPGVPQQVEEHMYNKFYMARFLRHSPSFNEPEWFTIAPTPDQAAYLAVAWDQYVESGGKSFAPLRGLGDLKLKKRKS